MFSNLFILSILTFLLILIPLVLFHELGHFLTAKLFRVKILEFGIGFPPKLVSFWTGTTHITISNQIKTDIKHENYFGKIIALNVSYESGQIVATSVKSAQSQDFALAAQGSVVVGKLRDISKNEAIVSEMLWSVNLLPLGGFVKMVGEESSNVIGSLGSKPHWQRLIVMASGALINLIIPLIIFPVIGLIPQKTITGQVIVNNVFPNSPAFEAGIKKGDIITSVEGKKIDEIRELQLMISSNLGEKIDVGLNRSIPNPFPRPDQKLFEYSGSEDEIKIIPRWKPPRRKVVLNPSDIDIEISLSDARIIDPNIGINNKLLVVNKVDDSIKEISVSKLKRIGKISSIGDEIYISENGEESESISIVEARKHNSNLGMNNFIQEGAIGVQIGMINQVEIVTSKNIWRSIIDGWYQILDMFLITKNSIKSSIMGSTNPQFQGPATMGPIGISQITGNIAVSNIEINTKIVSLLYITAAISLSLGVINLLPIPALDGGRIFFVIIEILRNGKRISHTKEALIHSIGFTLLIGLIILISIQDIIRILSGDLFP